MSRTLFDSPPWAAVLRQAYGFEVEYIHIQGGAALPYCALDLPTGRRVTSLPFVDYLDPTADEVKAALEQLKAQYPDRPIIFKTLLSPDALPELQPSRQAVLHRIPVADYQPDGKQRWSVRKSEKMGVTIHFTDTWERMQAFYSIYRELRFGKFGIIPQPLGFFEAVHEQFMEQGSGFIVEARHEGELLAALVVLEWEGVWYHKFSGSTAASLRYRPNNILFDRMLTRAREQSIDTVDLGLSGTSEAYAGLRHFKETMGGIAQPITYFTHTPGGYENPTAKATKKMLQQLTAEIVAADLDDTATSRLSQIIYPNFA